MKKRIDFIRSLLSQRQEQESAAISNNAYKLVEVLPFYLEENIEPYFFDERERKQHYRICHAIAKQYDLKKEMRQYMQDHWQKSSMTELTDRALQQLLAYMRSLEARVLER